MFEKRLEELQGDLIKRMNKLASPAVDPTAVTAGLEMLRNAKYSDLTITNSRWERSWKVHKAVMCERSPFFDACVRNKFKEAQDNIIDLPADDPKHIDYVLRYLYTYDLDIASVALTSPDKLNYISDSDAFTLFALADKYEIDSLRSHWKGVLVTRAQKLPSLRLQQPFRSTNYELATAKMTEDIKILVQFVESCYHCENPGIEFVRQVTIQRIVADTPEWVLVNGETKGPLLWHVFKEVMAAYPEFGIDVIRALAASKRNQPVVELLKYEAMSTLILNDTDVMLDLVSSLALSRS